VGAEAETGVIYSHSAAQLLASNPAITSHLTRFQCSPAIVHKEPPPHTDTNKAKARGVIHPLIMG